MDLLKKILNTYIAVVGALTCLCLMLAIIYVELLSHSIAGEFVDIRHDMIVTLCMIVLAGMVWASRLMLFDEPDWLLIRVVVVPAYALGASVALVLASRATPSSAAGASALDWLVVGALYLLGLAAGMSAVFSLFFPPEKIDDRRMTSMRSTQEVG